MINSDDKSKPETQSSDAAQAEPGQTPPDGETQTEQAQEAADSPPQAADGGSGEGVQGEGSRGEEAGGATADPDALREENDRLRDQVLRLMADMENLRRRTEREKADTANYAISNFARDVLAVNDNLERAVEAVPEEALAQDQTLKALHEGVLVTRRELLNTLERHSITVMVPKGERFDPNLHQAMFELENTEVPAGTVLEVVQPGYMIGERVLRPAMVGVSKGGPREPRPAAPDGEAAAAAADGQVVGAGTGHAGGPDGASPVNDDPTVDG